MDYAQSPIGDEDSLDRWLTWYLSKSLGTSTRLDAWFVIVSSDFEWILTVEIFLPSLANFMSQLSSPMWLAVYYIPTALSICRYNGLIRSDCQCFCRANYQPAPAGKFWPVLFEYFEDWRFSFLCDYLSSVKCIHTWELICLCVWHLPCGSRTTLLFFEHSSYPLLDVWSYHEYGIPMYPNCTFEFQHPLLIMTSCHFFVAVQ